MRRYPKNSPQAAARVIALTLLADGIVSRGELGSLARFEMHQRLGIDSKAMQAVLEDLARDLYEFGVPAWDHSGGLHPLVVRCVLDDVTDPPTRAEIYQICRDVAAADSHLSHGEQALLQLAASQWRLAAPAHLVQKGRS
jgi:uncharacterized tellurite resistance protein B-like protein